MDKEMEQIIEQLKTPLHLLTPRKVTETPIQKFYSGQNVLITGVTGFLGKCLLEKLLFSCPDIGNIYVLMREKRGKDSGSRLDTLLDSQLFIRLKNELPRYKEKIKIISGDCTQEGCGISTQDKAELLREINVLFHVAATVRFDEPLNIALSINLRATQDLVEMSKEMSNLKAFVHVSTAYCHCYSPNLGEHFYETPMDPMKLLKFVETADPEIIDAIAPKLIGKWPNTYSFSKGLTEDYLRQGGVGLPMGIFRPSIIISAYQEPLPNWADNWYGVNGYVTACGSGLLRATRVTRNGEANLVPVDMCTNGMIASAWDIHNRFKDVTANPATKLTSKDIRIYNFVLSENPIRWVEFYHYAVRGGEQTPPIKALWYRCLSMSSNKYMHAVNKFFLHYIPAIVFDTVAICSGQKPQIFSMYARIHKMEHVTEYFTNRQWTFSNQNTQKLIGKMTEEDKQLFECDVKKVNWQKFLMCYFLGIRRYLLKDDDSTIPAAQKRYSKLYMLHTFLKLIVYVVMLRGAYRAGKFINDRIKFSKLCVRN